MSSSKGKEQAPQNSPISEPKNPKDAQIPARDPVEGDIPDLTSAEFAGESSYEGHVLPGRYSRAGWALEDECIVIKLDDGREVEERGARAQKLRYAVGVWQDNMTVIVTCYGTTDRIKRVKVLTRVVDTGMDADLTLEDLD